MQPTFTATISVAAADLSCPDRGQSSFLGLKSPGAQTEIRHGFYSRGCLGEPLHSLQLFSGKAILDPELGLGLQLCFFGTVLIRKRGEGWQPWREGAAWKASALEGFKL